MRLCRAACRPGTSLHSAASDTLCLYLISPPPSHKIEPRCRVQYSTVQYSTVQYSTVQVHTAQFQSSAACWCVRGKYSSCSSTCGVGHKHRFRSVLQRPLHNGPTCGQLIETARCNTHRCPQICRVAEWGEFSMCSIPCGGGLQVPHIQIYSWLLWLFLFFGRTIYIQNTFCSFISSLSSLAVYLLVCVLFVCASPTCCL